MQLVHKPFILIVLDGFGYSEQSEYNAIQAAHTPTWDRLWREYPHALINASGTHVGLPGEQMGNSEVGHMSMGSGRIIRQEFSRISAAIASCENDIEMPRRAATSRRKLLASVGMSSRRSRSGGTWMWSTLMR